MPHIQDWQHRFCRNVKMGYWNWSLVLGESFRPAECGTPLQYWGGCSSESGRWRSRLVDPGLTHCDLRSPGLGPQPATQPDGRCCPPPRIGYSWVHFLPAGSQTPQANPGWMMACWGLERGEKPRHRHTERVRGGRAFRWNDFRLSQRMPCFTVSLLWKWSRYDATCYRKKKKKRPSLTHRGQHIQINPHYKSSKKSFDSKLSSLLLSLVSHCAPLTCTVTHSALPGLFHTSTAANQMMASQGLWPEKKTLLPLNFLKSVQMKSHHQC